MLAEKETTRVTWSRRSFKRCLCVYHFMSFFFAFFFYPCTEVVFSFSLSSLRSLSLSLFYSTGSSSWSPSSVSRVVSFSSKWRASRLTEGLLRGPTPGFNGLDASWGVDNLWGQRLLRIFGRKLSAPLQLPLFQTFFLIRAKSKYPWCIIEKSIVLSL